MLELVFPEDRYADCQSEVVRKILAKNFTLVCLQKRENQKPRLDSNVIIVNGILATLLEDDQQLEKLLKTNITDSKGYYSNQKQHIRYSLDPHGQQQSSSYRSLLIDFGPLSRQVFIDHLLENGIVFFQKSGSGLEEITKLVKVDTSNRNPYYPDILSVVNNISGERRHSQKVDDEL